VAVVVIAGIVTAVLLFRQSPPTRVVIDTPQSADATQPPATEPASTPTSDTDGTSTTLAGQFANQPARPLQSLLQNSTADRSAIVSATSDIGSCGDLAADVQTLTTAATNRQELLTQLTGLDLSALPTGSQLVSTLTAAWQASIQSDTDYASWGTDLEQSGCTGQAPTSDPNWQSAQSSDTSATFAKYEFVTLWNPIAGTEGLTEYQYGQL
jgi:hypothetical protein